MTTTFFLILVLLDSAMFGAPAKPRLMRQRSVVSSQSSATSTATSPCFTDPEGNVTCYPIDQADKFNR